MHLFVDEILKHDGITFDAIDEKSKDGQDMLDAIQEESIGRLGYFLKPSQLFSKVAERGGQKSNNFILEDLTAILKHIGPAPWATTAKRISKGFLKIST